MSGTFGQHTSFQDSKANCIKEHLWPNQKFNSVFVWGIFTSSMTVGSDFAGGFEFLVNSNTTTSLSIVSCLFNIFNFSEYFQGFECQKL